jgi:NADH-quinone oxidoreductase subunit K
MLIFLFFSVILFVIGCLGMFTSRRHLIVIILSLELLLLSSMINFVIFSIFFEDLVGQIFSFFIVVMAAAEAALGLSILVVYYRLRGGISVDLINLLKS